MNDDRQQLRLLTIFHYVVGGLTALLGCFPIIHLVLGIALLSGGIPQQNDQPFPQVLAGSIFALVGGFMILLMWSGAVCIFFAARCLDRRRRYMYCLVVAAIECLIVPFGTVLGVFTIVVLSRPSVKELFAVRGDVDNSRFDPWPESGTQASS